MLELNSLNGAGAITESIARELLHKFSGELYGCEMGIAWGGGVEKIGKIWKGIGTVWGFDTFEGHPRYLGDICKDTKEDGGWDGHAARCMEPYYREFEDKPYTYDYIRQQLDGQGLDNVILKKGLITETTDVSFIPRLHYILLDMDFPLSMRNGYNLIKDKIVSGGYLCLHDVVPPGHIHGLHEFYKEIVASGMYDVISENENASLLAVLRKK